MPGPAGLLVNPRGRPPLQLEWGSNAAIAASAGGGMLNVAFDYHLPNTLQATTFWNTGDSIGNPGNILGQSGGRFEITLAPRANMRAFKWWLVDPADPYQGLTGIEDLDFDGTTKRSVVFDGDSPYTFYVSALDSESRLLMIEPYPSGAAGVPIGTPGAAQGIVLELEGAVDVDVQSISPEGHSSARWRRLDFATSPNDFRYTWDDAFEIVSPTSVRPYGESFATGKFKLGYGRDCFIFRDVYGRGPFGDGDIQMPQTQFARGQWRRIVNLTNDGDIDNTTVIHYDRPFDPPLAVDERIWIVTSCVMARVTTGASNQTGDGLPAMYRPTPGVVFLDMWGLYNQINQSSTGGTDFRAHKDRLQVEYYFHNSGTTFGSGADDDSILALVLPRPRPKRLSLRADPPPRFVTWRVTEAADQDPDEAILRVEVGERVGRVDKWRVYLRKGEWPTLEAGSPNGMLDENYRVGEYPREQQVVEIPLGLGPDVDWRVIAVPFSAYGDEGGRRYTVFDFGPAAPAMLDSVTVEASDTALLSGNPQCNNVIKWVANNDAAAPSTSMWIEAWLESGEGMYFEEREVQVIAGPSTSLAEDGQFTHAWNTPKAEIGFRDNGDLPGMPTVGGEYIFPTQQVPSPFARRLTWCYALCLAVDNEVVQRHVVKRTDYYYNSQKLDNVAAYARVYSGGALDANGLMVEPLTVLLTLEARNMDRYEGTSNETIIVIEVRENGGAWKMLSEVRQPFYMGYEYLHTMWGYTNGGASDVTLEYRFSWRQFVFPFDRNDPVVSPPVTVAKLAATNPY